jgi:hypothetical protein
MTQREKILNSFSDSYLLAMLEGKDSDKVLSKFIHEFPELTSEFESNANSVKLLYGDIISGSKPSETEISAAYNKISKKLEPQGVHTAVTGTGFFARFKTYFSHNPMWAGASLGIGAAVIIALLWQPWTIKESLETAHHNSTEQEAPVEQKEFAVHENPVSSDPTKMPEVTYRGNAKKAEKLSPSQKRIQDSIDDARLQHMAEPKPLRAPKGLELEATSSGAITIIWNAAPDAVSYIVEIRSANDDTFDPVTQISGTRTRITHLESGKTYFVRVIAASGERVGPPSDVKSIVVP